MYQHSFRPFTLIFRLIKFECCIFGEWRSRTPDIWWLRWMVATIRSKISNVYIDFKLDRLAPFIQLLVLSKYFRRGIKIHFLIWGTGCTMQGVIDLIFVFNNYLVHQRRMQILGTSEYIQQCFGVSEKNANIRYIRKYTTIFGCIRDKCKY